MIEPLLDKKLILENNNVLEKINKPQKKGLALELNTSNDGHFNAYFSIIKYLDKFLLFYRSSPLLPEQVNHLSDVGFKHRFCRKYESTSYAESTDGIHFTRGNNGINNSSVLFNNNLSHNFFPFLAEPLSDSKFLAIGGTQENTDGLVLCKSDDYLNWIKNSIILTGRDLLPGWWHPNHFDTQNVSFYDYNTNNYKIYIRDNKPKQRHIQCVSTENFTHFSQPKNIEINYDSDLYTPCIYPYPNSKYYIGFPSTHNNIDLSKKCIYIFSIDGYNWDIIDNDPFPEINQNYMIAHGMIESLENKKLFIFNHIILDKQLICYSYDLHRIKEYYCNHTGSIVFGKFIINNIYNIQINCFSAESGYIKLSIIDDFDNLVAVSEKITGNNYFTDILWEKKLDIIASTINQKFKIKIELYKSSIYSLKLD